MVQGVARRHFTARDEALAYLVPGPLVLDLVRRNDRFASFFYLEISRKLDALAAEDEDQRVGAAHAGARVRHFRAAARRSSTPPTQSRPRASP